MGARGFLKKWACHATVRTGSSPPRKVLGWTIGQKTDACIFPGKLRGVPAGRQVHCRAGLVPTSNKGAQNFCKIFKDLAGKIGPDIEFTHNATRKEYHRNKKTLK